jgi:hypothetical protein
MLVSISCYVYDYVYPRVWKCSGGKVERQGIGLASERTCAISTIWSLLCLVAPNIAILFLIDPLGTVSSK